MIVIQAPGLPPAMFREGFTIGRAGAGQITGPILAVDDEYVSPFHVAVHPWGGGWVAEDLGSTNGSWLNGQRFYGPVPLAKGDKLRIGRTVLTVVPA